MDDFHVCVECAEMKYHLEMVNENICIDCYIHVEEKEEQPCQKESK